MCHAVRPCYCHYDWCINYALGHFAPCLRLQGHASFCLTRLWKLLGTLRLILTWLWKHVEACSPLSCGQLFRCSCLRCQWIIDILEAAAPLPFFNAKMRSFKGQIPSFVFFLLHSLLNIVWTTESWKSGPLWCHTQASFEVVDTFSLLASAQTPPRCWLRPLRL